MATLGGYNPKGYKGKYSGSTGRNSGRNPQPGFGGGGGGGGRKGCGGKKKIYPALAVIAILLIGGLTAIISAGCYIFVRLTA